MLKEVNDELEYGVGNQKNMSCVFEKEKSRIYENEKFKNWN